MAGTTVNATATELAVGSPRSVPIETTAAYNKLVADVEVVRAGLAALAASFNLVLTKLDADSGVGDTNYSATRAVVATTYDAAGDLTAPLVAVGGTTIT